MHSQIAEEKGRGQLKSAAAQYLWSQNHKARREWMWRHCIDGTTTWISHKQCIGRFTRRRNMLLLKLRRDKLSFVEGRVVPVCRVLASYELLGELKAPAGAIYEQWWTLKARRVWLKDLIESSSNLSTPIDFMRVLETRHYLETPLKKQELSQHTLFCSFVNINSMPAGRHARDKQFILCSSIKTIRSPVVSCEHTGNTEQVKYHDKVKSFSVISSIPHILMHLHRIFRNRSVERRFDYRWNLQVTNAVYVPIGQIIAIGALSLEMSLWVRS